MSRSTPKRLFKLVVLATAAAAVVYVVVQVRIKKEAADATVDRMQQEIDKLDPATRAMVRARLAADSMRGLKDRVGSIGGRSLAS